MAIRLPRRLSDPLASSQGYVARRVGQADAQREQRRVRDLERQPRPDLGVSVQSLGQAPTDIEALDINQVYRVQGGPGVSDQILIRIKDATNTETTLDLGVISIEDIAGSPVVGGLENNQLYRNLGASGVADKLIARMKNAANTVVVQAISLVGHLHSEYALLVHVHPYAPLVHTHGFSILAPMQQNTTTLSPGESDELTAICPSGYFCTGGGVRHDQAFNTANISYSYPESNGWRAAVFNGDATSCTMTVYAICVLSTVA